MLAAKHRSSPPIKTRWQLRDRNRACKWGSVFPKRKVMSSDNNDAVKWDSQREKSSWREAAALTSGVMKRFNLFQLPALKNTDYITADLQCIPGPLKYLRSMCAVTVARQWSLARCEFAWKTHRSLRYTLTYTTFTVNGTPVRRARSQQECLTRGELM